MLLLGREESRYGHFRMEEPLEGVACALSVGSDQASPSLSFKGDPLVPNEDALLVAWSADHLLMAVADGHRGALCSHELLQRMAGWRAIPHNQGELALLTTCLTDPPWPGPSGSTLAVAVMDRHRGRVFGLSWGDSRACVLRQEQAQYANLGNERFLRGNQPCEPDWSETLDLQLDSGELLMLFTDGVYECHYRSPLTSVGLEDLARARNQAGSSAGSVCQEVVTQALHGVRGFPGGQDNLALIVARYEP